MKHLFTTFLFFIITIKMLAQPVNTQFGQVQGAVNGTVYQFLGIPFASPPVDSLRWKAPRNPNSWASVLTTTSFAPVCPQKSYDQGGVHDTIVGNEDCLYLNVWSPQLGSANLPVMVFIHGGGNQQGSASEVSAGAQIYFGKNLSSRGNVVVVTIQYRLGPLGFLVHPGLEAENANATAGNYAVMDQILALKWVQNNIANFGGDPTRVMIFGESAGGVDVGNLLISPLASGLFQRAAIQSAIPVLADYSSAKINGIHYVDSFTTTGTDAQKISYMRSLPADSLVKYEAPPLIGGAVGMHWQSVVDNIHFLDYPTARIQSGNFNKVPLVIGSNAEEMSLSVPQTITPAMVTALINSKLPVAFRAQAATLYPAGTTNAEAKVSYIGLLTDGQFTATTRRIARCISQNQTEPVYRYFFSHKHTVAALTPYGSYHGMELFYVFNNWENATLGTGPLFKAQDDSVQKAMLAYWTNFAKTGNPNASGLVNWPQYQSAPDCYLEIKATPDGSACGLRTAKSDFWDAVSSFTGCTTSVGIKHIGGDYLLSIYPNPTNGLFQLHISDGQQVEEVNVYNTFGQKVFTSANVNTIDLTSQSEGVYLVEVKSGGKTMNGKLTKL